MSPPAPGTANFAPPELWADAFERIFEHCPDLSRSDAALDCAEFPCQFFFRRSALAVPTGCDLLDEMMSDPENVPEEMEGLPAEWVAYAGLLPREQEYLESFTPIIESRERARVAASVEWLMTREPDDSVNIGDASCATIRRQLALMRPEEPCALLRDAWGCDLQESEALPVEAVERTRSGGLRVSGW